MLTEDRRLLGQRQMTLLLMRKALLEFCVGCRRVLMLLSSHRAVQRAEHGHLHAQRVVL